MKRIHSLFLAIVLLSSLTAVLVLAFDQTYIDDEAYQYPIQPGTEEWVTFDTKAEKLALLQIPEEKLSSMTTRALLETVLDYPYILDYGCFNTLETAYNTLYSDFNGFRVLLERTDLTDVLLAEYALAEVPTPEKEARGVVSTQDFFQVANIEFLLVSDQLHNGKYSMDKAQELNRIELQKNEERKATGLYSSSSILQQQRRNEMLEAGINQSGSIPQK